MAAVLSRSIWVKSPSWWHDTMKNADWVFSHNLEFVFLHFVPKQLLTDLYQHQSDQIDFL